MTEIMKSDIFFFVTTSAVVVISLFLVVALVYVIRILRSAQKLSEMARQEGEAILATVGSMRSNIATVVGSLFTSKKRKRKNETNKTNETEE